MAKRSINSNIESHLINNEPFEYAHLVKFERPFHPKNGAFRTNANRYVYLTDGARDITFDADGDSSAETYRANGIIGIGSYSETTEARATSMTLSLAGETLGTSVTVTGNLNSSGTFATTGEFVDGYILDFVEKGFREGDKIKIEKANGTNFSDGTSAKIYIISSFSNNNQDLTFARTGTDTDDSTFITLNSTSFTFTLINEEIRGALLDKGTEAFSSAQVVNSTSITLEAANSKIEIGQLVTGLGVEDETIVTSINGTSLVVSKTQTNIAAGAKLVFTNPNFINREVFIYKVFLDTDGSIIGNSSILVFKGIINGTNIQESETSSRVQWNLSSHWGDFDAVVGRITTDELHRALDTNGKPNPDLADRPDYAYDLGFLHAETSLNTIAIYQTTRTEYELKKKRQGGLGGLLGGKKYTMVEKQVQVDNEVDLSVFLQGKYLPVVYGVQRVPGIPVFADTKANNSKEVYVVYAISEGENHGIYNLYIDGAPLICVDKADYDTRNTNSSTSDSQQLQCYGRADQGGTLGGAVVSGSTNYVYYDDEEDLYDYSESGTYNSRDNSVRVNTRRYSYYDEANITEASVSDSAEGLQHQETASINHPYAMHFTFYSGRDYQSGDNNLTTIAASNGFKRQSSYYSGNEAYWSPDHKLLDTAYAVMKFTIEEDQTTIPEIEYVVKGKVLECFNYDGTYVPDAVLGASDSHTNFVEGDSVTVEKSTNGTSWTSVGTFRILDKYQFTTARNSTHYRFRLDSVPNLGTDTYVRLNDGSSNYWHMLTHDHALVASATSLPAQSLSITSLQTNSSGVLSATLSTAAATKLQALYPNISSSQSTSDAMIQFTGNTDGIFTSLKRATLQATLSGTTLTFPNTSYSANQSSTGTLSGINIQAAEVFDLSTISVVSAITDTDEIIGCNLEIVETGESKRITAFDATNDYVTIEAPFITPPTSSNTFKITGRGKDLRSSINPAIQTADLLTNSRYGKGLDISNDIDLASIKAAALICDTRSDVTIPLSSAASCVANDIYKLTDDGLSTGNHVASGKVLSSTSTSSRVVFTDVSGKFIRNYENYIYYNIGDVVTNIVNGQSEYYRVTSGAGYKATAPTHTTGTVNGFLHLTSLTLHKVSGSGPATLSVAKDGRLLTYSLYDSDFVKYWRYIGWEENRQWCVTRHQTNFIFDTSRSIFENINALLSHYNGILSYSNGKYVLDVETQVDAPTASISNGIQSNPLYIDNDDIVGSISLIDNSQRNSKNTIKASIADPQNNFSSRSVSFFNSDFLKADRNIVKTGSYPITGITSYYNARIGVEKELIQSRYSKEISFTVGPRGILLKPGEVIALTYPPFGFNSKLFRIENLTYSANCNTQVKATEYDDSIYAITPQVASSAQKATTGDDSGLKKPGTPTTLTTSTTKPGIITLNWANASNYKELTDSTEIWRASSQGTSGAITDHATLITVVDDATTYNDALGTAGNFYYWIRHIRRARRNLDNALVKLNGDFDSAITAGELGTAKVSSPQLDVDVSAGQIKFNSSNVLTPTGAAQDVTLTATLRNITPNASGVVFTLVDADQSSQTDVQFTNASTTVTDTSSPYQATVDASTFEHTTTNKFVKVTVTDTTGETFTELVPFSVTIDGSSGSIGADAIAVKLEASQYVISYSAQGTEADTISLTTTLQGSGEFTGTPYYEFLVDGTSKQNTTTTTYTVLDADEPGVDENKTITVKVRDGGTTGTIKATDSISVYGIASGSDSTTAFLTNSAHVVPTNESGTIDSSLITGGNINSAGGTFNVYIGTTDRTTSCTYTVQSESGVDVTIGANTGIYTVSSTGLSDYGVAVFRVTVPSNISPTGTQFTIDQTYTIAKSKKGNAGADGDDAKTVRLTAGDYSIVYDADGANPDPSGTITLTATSQNFVDGHFKFTGDGITDETSYTDGTTANSDTFSFTVPSTHFTSPKALRVGVSEGTAATTEIAFDTINIFAVKEGSNAYTVVLDNESHALPADENGANLSFTGSGCTIEVYKGSTALNGVTTGTPTSGQFKVTATGSGITPSSTNGTSTANPVIFADHSGMTGTSASISYSINIENIQTVLKKQTFTRVDKGDAGQDGDRGRKVQELVIYYKQTFSGSSLSAPTTPSTGTYNFSTGIVASLPSGWTQAKPTFSAGSVIWKSTTLALETTSLNDVSGTLSWSSPGVADSPINDINFIFRRSATQPSTPSATSWPTIPTSWYDNVGNVPAGSNPIWVSKGLTTYAAGASFTFTTTWQAANLIEGSDGDNIANVVLYQRTSTNNPPSVINDTSTYTFSTGVLSNVNGLDGWSQNVPSGTGQYLWATTATAIGASGASTASILTGAWSTPGIQSEAQQPRVEIKKVYYDAWNYGSLPSAPSTASMAYSYTTHTLTGLPTGWSTSVGTVPYAYADVTITEASYNGTKTFSVGPVRPKGDKFDTIDIDDIDIGFSSADTIQVRIGSTGLGTTTYQTGAVNSGLKNSQITTKADGTLNYDGTAAVAPNINNIPDSGNTKTYAGYAGTGLDSSGRLKTSIISGASTFSAAELLNVRGAFANVGTTPLLNIANANTGLRNSQITTKADGTLNYDGTAAVAPSVDSITGIANFQSRVTTGLTSSGILNTTVPVAKGGTGETNTNKFLNSGISISQGASGVFTLNKGDGTTATTTITKSLLGLNYADGATVGATWGTNVSGRPTELTDGRIATAINSTGKITGNITNGTTDFTPAELLNVRGAFANVGTTPVLNVANANTGLRNSSISISASGALSGAGGGTVTAAGISAIQTNLGNAPDSIKNDNISISAGNSGVLTLTKYTGATATTTITKANLGLNYTDGADITSQNTAAAITGQGSLATKSSVDFSTEVGGATKPANNATNNGTTINTSGNVTGSMSVASGGSITIGNVTIDGTNGRILITD